MPNNEALARKIAARYALAEDGSTRKADLLRQYKALVAQLGYDPLV